MTSPITREEKTNFQPQQQQQRYSAASKNEYETYSSSSSTMSEHFPIRLIVNTQHVPAPYNSEPYVLPRPKRLQPQCLPEQETSQHPKSFSVSTKCEYSAEYYSCSSASSEEDNPDCSTKSTDQDRNAALLQLMHQMVHLLTEEVMLRKDIPRDFDPKNIHVAPELREPMTDANVPMLATSTQSQQFACSKLRILLEESHKHKSEDSQTTHPSGELLKTSTLSSSINDEDTSCDCSRRKTLSNPTTTLPHLQIPPPCPCFHYYTSIWASAQGFGIPIPEELDQWNKLFPNNPLRISQHSIKEEGETAESKCRNGSDPQSEKELNVNNEDSEKDVVEVIEPYELSPKPLDNFYYSEEADTVNPTENEEKVPTQHLEFVENRNALKEIGYTDEESQLHALYTEPYGMPYDKEEPDRQISNHDDEVLKNQNNSLLNTSMTKNEELGKEPISEEISNLEPEIIKRYYHEESHEETPYLPESKTIDDIHFDNDISEGSDDELAKEKLDERCKNRSHKDSCKCSSKQYTKLTKNQQQSPGVEEFVSNPLLFYSIHSQSPSLIVLLLLNCRNISLTQ